MSSMIGGRRVTEDSSSSPAVKISLRDADKHLIKEAICLGHEGPNIKNRLNEAQAALTFAED